jgi:hypothetical protein
VDPLGVERPAEELFYQANDAPDIVDVAEEGTVEIPIIDSADHDLPLAFREFAKGATEKARAGGTAVEGKTAPIHAPIARALGVQEATDSGFIPIQEADELTTVEVRIDEPEALLAFRLLPISQDPVNRPWNQGEALGPSSQTTGQFTSPGLRHVIETTTPGATLAVIRLTE